jgi:hypothetical protein
MLSEQFTKSTHSLNNGTCVEARWIKSTHSLGSGTCVEARTGDGVVQMRDSKLGDDSPILEFSPPAWQAFLDGITAGEFHQP